MLRATRAPPPDSRGVRFSHSERTRALFRTRNARKVHGKQLDDVSSTLKSGQLCEPFFHSKNRKIRCWRRRTVHFSTRNRLQEMRSHMVLAASLRTFGEIFRCSFRTRFFSVNPSGNLNFFGVALAFVLKMHTLVLSEC